MSRSFLRLPDVMRRTGLPRSSLYALIKQGAFPRQIQLPGRSVAWLESDVSDWIESCVHRQKQGHSA
jgi:prophage regulatory protein